MWVRGDLYGAGDCLGRSGLAVIGITIITDRPKIRRLPAGSTILAAGSAVEAVAVLVAVMASAAAAVAALVEVPAAASVEAVDKRKKRPD